MKRNKQYLALLLAICTLLIFIWFKSGRFLAAAEEGPSLFKPALTASKYSEPWSPVGTGYLFPVGVPRVTFYMFAAFLNEFIEIWKVQAVIFWILACTGVAGTYFLTNYFTKDKKAAFFAGIFYLLNIYSLSQVWSRFIYAGMYAWAYLPLFLWSIFKWIEEKRIMYLAVLLMSSLFFSNTFGTPAFIFTFWVPVVLYTLFSSTSIKKSLIQERKLLYFFVAFALWAIVNIWWVYPYLIFGKHAYIQIGDVVENNLGSLQTVSQFFPIRSILLLRQDFLLGKGSWWFDFYNNPLVILVSILIFIIVLIGWLKSKSQLLHWKYLTVWAFLSLFIVKGSNFPVGTIFYKFIFTNFPSTMLLRNPYEKFGISWLLVYSLFLGIGISKIASSENRFLKYSFVVFLFFVYFVLVWPFWNGQVFPDAYGYRISVPNYYQDLDNWFRRNQINGRVLFLPLVPDEGVRYSWGYGGIEPSEFWFTPQTVSKILRVDGYYYKYQDMYKAFISEGDYEEFIRQMNIEYIVLHEDIDVEVTKSTSSAQVKKLLDKSQNVVFVDDFGKLKLYENRLENKNLFLADGESPPNIKYRKISNSCYLVDVSNATNPYKLIFKETFSDLWEAKVDDVIIGGHEIVYDYANQWEIDRRGDYQIKIQLRNWVCSEALGNIQKWLLMQD